MTETFSLTFSDQGENHPGMQLVGSISEVGQGFSLHDLKTIESNFLEAGYQTEFHRLNDLYQDSNIQKIIQEAAVLVIRDGLQYFLNQIGKTQEDMIEEMKQFSWDQKYFDVRRQKVLNKHARNNVCFGSVSQEPDYPNKKGTIISYDQVPILKELRNKLPTMLGVKGKNLICEGNRYYNLKKYGIGWHGDKERRKVVAFRLGEEMNLNYHWFHKYKSLGKILELKLKGGDMYIMSEKAVGTDWNQGSKYTLRHAAGLPNSKYLKITK